MKGKLSLLILALAFFVGPAIAQTTHTVTLTWVDGKNPTGVTYTVYRATGLCSGTPTFSKLATGVAVLTYADTTVTPGNYCYQVTATVAGLESSPSNQAAAAVLPFAVTSLAVTVQ